VARKRRRLFGRFRDFLQANFIAGMFVAVPLGITVAALYWVWQKIDGPLKTVFEVTQPTDSTNDPLSHLLKLFSEQPEVKDAVVSLLGLMILLVAVLILGMIIRSILGRYLLSVFDGLLARVPIAGTIYNALRQLAVAFVDDTGKSKFRRAVLVQFPVAGTWAIGFETSTAFEPFSKAITGAEPAKEGATPEKKTEFVTVFVPTTPLPTQGFTLILPRSETRELPLTVQEAMKLVISGGILTKSDETLRITADEK
jgi:uncharacterized membrane protein